MNKNDEDILDCVFHSCALRAFLQVAIEQGAMPDSETTRRVAYRLYEEALREKNAGTAAPRPIP